MMVGVSLLALGLLFQLVRVQFGPYAPIFADWAETSAGRLERLVPARGNIYDRNGNLLATNATRYIAEIEVRQLHSQSRQDIATTMSELLALPFEDIKAQLDTDWISVGQYRIRLTQKDDKGQTWPIGIEKQEAQILFALQEDPLGPDLSGLDLVPAPRRVYPAGSLAGHLLGFVNQEGKGFYGVEGYYDEWLSGRPLTVERPIIPPEARVAPDPPAGVNLVLTIDSGIQQTAEIVLREAIDDSDAESGQILVMDPRNGEILAMAAWPPLNPNDYDEWLPGGKPSVGESDKKESDSEEDDEDSDSDKKDEDEEPVITPGVAGQYEPGSTFKVLTMAAALDAGVVTPLEQFIDTGEIEVGGHTIRNWDGRGYGPVDMIGCLRYSLNVCLAHIAADELGASLFYDYMSAFGIGQITGADLAGEIPGFEDVTAAAAVAGNPEDWSTGTAFFDMDNDGDLDLFVANYVTWSRAIDLEIGFRLAGLGRSYGAPNHHQGALNRLYRNNGDGSFTEVSQAAGIAVTDPADGRAVGKALGVTVADIDRDGLLDILVANDTTRNFLYRNLGGGRFEEVGVLEGVAYDREGKATGGMGIDVANFRNDADLGIAIGNFANEMSSLFVTLDGRGPLVDEAVLEGFGPDSRLALTFAVLFLDADLDGRLDLFQANGHLESEINRVHPSQTYAQPAQLFWNCGDACPQRFQLLDNTADLRQPLVGRGAAYADIDGDGDLDLAILQNGRPAVLLRNDQQTGHHWLRLKLVGSAANRDAIGAEVEVRVGEVVQRRAVMPGRGYISQVELPLTFGLGTAERVDELKVTWPGGQVQRVPAPQIDTLLTLRQESGT